MTGDADPEPADPEALEFGRHLKRLREVRELTQEELALASGLSSDSIRRLERGEFSPSLRTLRKVARGLNLSVNQLFQGLDLAAEDDDATRDLAMLVRGRGPQTIARIMDLARLFLQALDEHDRALRQPQDLPPPDERSPGPAAV